MSEQKNRQYNKNPDKLRFFEAYLEKKKWKFRNDIIRNRILWSEKGDDHYIPLEKENDKKLLRTIRREHDDLSISYVIETILDPELAPQFNPIKEWLESLHYDAQEGDYFAELCDYIELTNGTDDEYRRFHIALAKWFVGAIKTLYHPNYVHKSAIILQGPSGIGKTPFISSILPPDLIDFFKSSPSLDLENKDSKIALTNTFLINLDEIDEFLKTKRNRDNYKSYMTEKYVNVRPPYGKKAVSTQRIASFWGTCNSGTFLNDPTGTQRFTIFSVERFRNRSFFGDHPKLIEDFPMEKLWAYAFYLYSKKKFNPEYTRQEVVANEAANEAYKYNSAEYEALVKHCTPALQNEGEFLTTTELRTLLSEKQNDFAFNNINLGKALARLGYKRSKKRKNKNSVYGYYVSFLLQDIEPNNTPTSTPNFPHSNPKF